jgi:hypothetical protein
MTYNEAAALKSQNKNVFGKPFQDSVVKYIFISTEERISAVLEQMLKYDHSNETALANLGILNSTKLDVFILPDLDRGLAAYGRLQEYIERAH